MSKLVQIGSVPWTKQDMINSIDQFLEIYNKRPIKNNHGGMGSVQAFLFYFLLKQVRPKYVIESGIWKGFSTWLIQETLPNAEIHSIDPVLERIEYFSDKENTFYHRQDFTTTDWGVLVEPEETLLFLDDHQNPITRIKHCLEMGIKKIITEDNYCSGQGDCDSFKKIFDRNDETTRFIRDITKIYYEMNPVATLEKNRWNEPWNIHACQEPLFDYEDIKDRFSKDDVLQYTFLAYCELK